MKSLFQIAVLAIAITGTVGCAGIDELYRPHPRLTEHDPIAPEANPDPIILADMDGSLWPGESNWNLFADHKALRKGDIVFVEISHKNEGKKDASTNVARKSSIAASIAALFGYADDINDITPAAQEDLIAAESESTFNGSGKTERKDDLDATVSAVIVDVLTNGHLVIYGHQIVQVNDEASVLTVQGIVRPADITTENTIDAKRIANARIEFSGAGTVSEHQRVGWGQRIFAYVWPF